MTVSLDEITRLAGVSRTTVSMILNGKAKEYRISAKTKARVMALVTVRQLLQKSVDGMIIMSVLADCAAHRKINRKKI